MPANAFKTLFILLILLATCTQCLLNEKKVSRYTPSYLGLWTSGISESAILIFGRVLACAGSGVNKVTDDFGSDIKIEISHRNRDISVKYVLTLVPRFQLQKPTRLYNQRSKSA